MTDRDSLEMLAAEFVLGTLDADERRSVQSRRQSDPEFDALVAFWESSLAPIADDIEPVQPSPDLLARIERQLDGQYGAAHGGADQTAFGAENASIVALRHRLRRWQWSAGIASIAAMVLLAVLLVQPVTRPDAQSFVAVFQENDQQPAFMLTVDLNDRELNLRPVTARPVEGKSYQLWIKADPLGPRPQSVGVIGDDLSLEAGALRQYDPQLLRQATFGISLEPEGGSPTGQPTGPAIHGYLYPTDKASGVQHL